MSIKHTLPDVTWAKHYTPAQYAAHILARTAYGMRTSNSNQQIQIQIALALTRQWRKTLPEQHTRVDDIKDLSKRGLLRAAALNIIDADIPSPTHATAQALRWAEACQRTWLKRQHP